MVAVDLRGRPETRGGSPVAPLRCFAGHATVPALTCALHRGPAPVDRLRPLRGRACYRVGATPAHAGGPQRPLPRATRPRLDASRSKRFAPRTEAAFLPRTSSRLPVRPGRRFTGGRRRCRRCRRRFLGGSYAVPVSSLPTDALPVYRRASAASDLARQPTALRRGRRAIERWLALPADGASSDTRPRSCSATRS
jgi:hypothetical protein